MEKNCANCRCFIISAVCKQTNEKKNGAHERTNKRKITTTTTTTTEYVQRSCLTRKKSRRNSNKCLKSIATSEAFDRYRQQTARETTKMK